MEVLLRRSPTTACTSTRTTDPSSPTSKCKNEARQLGHGDKRDDQKCWLPLDSRTNLIQILTTPSFGLRRPSTPPSTLASTATSATHRTARLSAESSFRPRRRRSSPASYVTLTSTNLRCCQTGSRRCYLATALIEVMSWHTADEVYLGQRASTAWTDGKEVLQKFEEFGENLQKAEKKTDDRNRSQKLKNRLGPTKVPCTLLFPDTSNMGTQRGVSGKGIPNSVSI